MTPKTVVGSEDRPPCCVCPPGCAGLDPPPGGVECSMLCSICLHGCPAGLGDPCCRDETGSTGP